MSRDIDVAGDRVLLLLPLAERHAIGERARVGANALGRVLHHLAARYLTELDPPAHRRWSPCRPPITSGLLAGEIIGRVSVDPSHHGVEVSVHRTLVLGHDRSRR